MKYRHLFVETQLGQARLDLNSFILILTWLFQGVFFLAESGLRMKTLAVKTSTIGMFMT